MHLPASADRVKQHTADHLNAQIRQRTQASIDRLARTPHLIEQRLRELDREWDVERILETNAATLALSGVLLGLATNHRRWLLLSAGVTGFLLQHGLQGWCPPLAVLRRMGVRTVREIEAERYALMAIRGDFEGASPQTPRETAEVTGRLGDRRIRPRTSSHATAIGGTSP